MGRALIGCCPVATANQSSPHSGPILSGIVQETKSDHRDNGIFGIIFQFKMCVDGNIVLATPQ